MAATSEQDLSTPEACVETFLRAWRDGDPEAQWRCMLKADPDGRTIVHHVTNAIARELDFAAFSELFVENKAKYYDRYELRRLRFSRKSPDAARVRYAARRKTSLLHSLPFALSTLGWVTDVLGWLFGRSPWYDALSYYDVVRRGGEWLVEDWRYYKY